MAEEGSKTVYDLIREEKEAKEASAVISKFLGREIQVRGGVVDPKYFMTAEQQKQLAGCVGWIGPGVSSPPRHAYCLSFDIKDELEATTTDIISAKLKSVFPRIRIGRWEVHNRELIREEKIEVVRKPGFDELLIVLKRLLPSITPEKLERLGCGSVKDVDGDPEGVYNEFDSADYEFNTWLVNVNRTPRLYRDFTTSGITVTLTVDDFNAGKSKLV